MIVADHFLCVMSGLIHTERGVTTGSKIMFSLSSVILFNMIGVDSCVFLIFTTRVGLKTRLNGVKSIFFEQSQKVSVYVFGSKRIDFRAILRNTLGTPLVTLLSPHRPRLVVSRS